MATEGTSGEKPPPVQTLATASHGSLEARCEFNVDNLSKPELLTLLSIMEGELEARDLVIEALRARRKETFIQERYACFTLTDPFLALQRDGQPGGGDKEGRSLGTSPISVLEAMMAHCRKMQEKMSAQLAAAEVRQKKLEQEKEQLQGLQQEHRRLSAQLKDEREKNKHIVTMLVRECRQLAARVVEESQRFEELSARFQEEGKASGQLEKELKAERQKGQEMEARMEKQLSEMDVEREQLRASLGREEVRCAELKEESVGLSRQLEELRTKRAGKAPAPTSTTPAAATAPKATASVAVETDPANMRTSSCQTDPMPLAVPTKTLGGNYGTAPLPKTGVHSGMPRGQAYSCPGGLLQSENGPSGAETLPTFAPATPIHGLHSPGTPTGVSPRVQAARYKFQSPPSEQDQNGTGSQSPRSREASPSSRDLVAKQQARHTVTQVLSRFTSPPAGGGALRPGLPHSASEGGPFPGRLGHGQIKSPTAGKVDRGNPPPVPPKKPGLSQASAAPHPPIKGAGDGSRSPGSAVGVPSKPGTPMLPPKPALDIAGTGGASPVPALTASQVGAHPPLGPEPQWKACAECHPVTVAVVSSPPINPVSASSCRPSCDSDRPLAAASGWTSSIDSSLPRGDPASLADGRTLLLEAATQGNVTLLSMLLNPDPKDIIHNCEDTNAALFSAAQNGNTECIELLLATGASAEASDANGLTALHMAAAYGQHRCIELLLGVTADVNQVTTEGQSALFLASASDNPECVRALLDAGADRSLATTDGETALHAAAAGGHFGSVELLLYHPSRQESSLLNFCNRDGWTPAFVAAANGYKKCLELLCGHSPHDLEQRDACNRTIHHVATDDCKNLLENLYSYRVLVRIQRGSEEQICMVDVMEDGPTVGVVTVHKETRWDELCQALMGTLTSHFHLLTSGEDGGRDLGLNADSISSVLIGNVVWNMDQEPSQSPWDLVRKCHCQHITVKLKGLQESSLDELAYDSLIPLQLLSNYVRLVEQYRNVILHGLEGSCQGYIANQIALCIKHRLEAQGVGCDIITVEMEEDLSKEQLLETFINCGFLVPVSQAAAAGRSAVLILEGLEKVHSLSELLGDLCDSLETRGVAYPVPLLHAQEGCCLHQFQEGGFLIGTLSKPHLQGAELLLQQHFRWVQLRWDSEPIAGLLTRHLRRKLVHKMKGQVPARSDVLWRTMAWVCSVWQQLNSCVSRLGTPEALMGPQMFLSCPVIPGQTQAVVKWLTRLWNLVVVPRVEEAVISRVTARKSVAQQQSPGNGNLSPNQQAVVKAALSILVNKVILHGCPLPRPEIDKHLAEFRGSRFPLSALGSYKGGGRRKGRDSAAWRRANTSPRKKSSSPLSAWGSGGGLREGSLSSNDLLSNGKSVTPQSCAGEEPTRFSLVSDDETDLMLQLQTMCSSKSEPDIRKIPPSCEDFIMFTGAHSGQTTLKEDTVEADQTPAKERCPSSSHAPGAPSCEKRTARPKSQLPVPSSKSIQGTQSSGSVSRTSSKTRHAPPSNNHSQSQDIWILQRDSHANNNK